MSKNQDLMIKIITGNVNSENISEVVNLFKGKTPADRNLFLNQLGIKVKNDPNEQAEVSFSRISNSALHTLTKELILYHANNIFEDNTFLRRDGEYCGLLRKLLAEEGMRHPLDSDGSVPDIIVDHFKSVLEVAPQVLNSLTSINIDDIARNISFNVYGTQPVNTSTLNNKLQSDMLDLATPLEVASARDIGISDEITTDEIAFAQKLSHVLEPKIPAPVKVIEAPKSFLSTAWDKFCGVFSKWMKSPEPSPVKELDSSAFKILLTKDLLELPSKIIAESALENHEEVEISGQVAVASAAAAA